MAGKIKQVVAEVIGDGKLTEERTKQSRSDLRDTKDGVYDAVNREGLPRGDQPETDPLEPNLPEGLRRERKGPLDKDTGRHEHDPKR